MVAAATAAVAVVDMAAAVAVVDMAVEAVATDVVAAATAAVDMAVEAVRMANDAQEPAAGRIAVMGLAITATVVAMGVMRMDAAAGVGDRPPREEMTIPDTAALRVELVLKAGVAELLASCFQNFKPSIPTLGVQTQLPPPVPGAGNPFNQLHEMAA